MRELDRLQDIPYDSNLMVISTERLNLSHAIRDKKSVLEQNSIKRSGLMKGIADIKSQTDFNSTKKGGLQVYHTMNGNYNSFIPNHL